MKPVNIVSVHNVGSQGIVSDQPSHTLPPEAWSSGQNVRFSSAGVRKSLGEVDVFGTPLTGPDFLMAVPSASTTFWLYTSRTKAYVQDSGVHGNITRQTAGVDVDYTTTADSAWNGALLGGVPVLNNGADVPQYWPNYDITTKLTALPNWPSTLRAGVIRAFGRYLLALNLVDNTNQFPHALQWSAPADPGSVPTSWDFTNPAVDAGRIELTDSLGGPIRDGLMLGNAMAIYKANSTHMLRFVGGEDIFAPDLLLTTSGILAPNCVAEIKKGTEHFVVTESDVLTHAGQKNAASVIDRRNRTWLFNNIDQLSFAKSFAFDNPQQNEAWFAFPVTGSSKVNLAAVWNYRDDTWTFRELDASFAAYGLIAPPSFITWAAASGAWDDDIDRWSEAGNRGVLLANKTRTRLSKLDQGLAINGSPVVSVLTRTGLAIIGRDRQGQPKNDFQVVKQLKRITPKMTGSGSVLIRAGSQESHDGPVTWSEGQVFEVGVTPYIDFTPPIVGKLLAVQFSCATGSNWQLEGYDLELALLGNLGG